MTNANDADPAPVHHLVGRGYFYVNMVMIMVLQYFITLYMYHADIVCIFGSLLFFPIGFALGMSIVGRKMLELPNSVLDGLQTPEQCNRPT